MERNAFVQGLFSPDLVDELETDNPKIVLYSSAATTHQILSIYVSDDGKSIYIDIEQE